MSYQIGDRAGDYEIVDVLGAGGMGKVYKVRNVISERVEAMKVLLPNLESDPDLADRFMREIKVQASLQHPNIAVLHTAQRLNNQLVMLIEFVEGKTLESELRNGPIPPVRAIDYTTQVLAALGYAHSHGVVHRDIKPANMMLMPSGVVKLMDFGIARLSADRRLTQTGRTLGSLYYMSPEQIQGALDLDARSDLYSLGVTLYELLTNRRPFQGDSDYSIMAAHLSATPVPPIQIDPTLPEALNDVILMAIAKEPAKRFQTAEALRKALESVGASLKKAPPLSATRVIPGAAAAAVAAPAPSPIPVASAPTPARLEAAPKSRRVLYMAVGSIATLIVLVVAALQAPKFFGSSAASDVPVATTPAPAPQPQQQAPEQPVEAPPVVASRPAAEPSPAQSSPVTLQEPAASRAPQRAQQRAQQVVPAPAARVQTPPPATYAPAYQPQTAAPAAAQPATTPPPPAVDTERQEALRAARDTLIQLGTRANASRASLATIKQQQARMGANLRADISAAEQRMETYLDEAESAMKAGDPVRAKRSLDLAERALEVVEKFLGR